MPEIPKSELEESVSSSLDSSQESKLTLELPLEINKPETYVPFSLRISRLPLYFSVFIGKEPGNMYTL